MDIVFYSWQSDLPNPTNRGFIEGALERAAKSIRGDDSVVVEPRIDRDTDGVPGAPDIAQTIRQKIDSSRVFVADVSLINSSWITRLLRQRETPNPNVLVELGYAQKALDDSGVILVFNDAYGKCERLPFDLRGKRVVRYKMRKSEQDRATERNKLAKNLEARLREILEASSSLSLTLKAIKREKPHDSSFQAYFRLKNDGDRHVLFPTVILRLPKNVTAAGIGRGWIEEHSGDFFEPNGRVGIAKPMSDAEPLLSGHHKDFFGLVIPEEHYIIGSNVAIDYQIDAQDHERTHGNLLGTIS